MAVQEDHDLAHDLLLGPSCGDAAGADGTDAVHLLQAMGLRLDDVEYLLAEGAQQLLGVNRADAADHSRREILFNPFGRGGCGSLEKARLKLLAVGAIINPVARGCNPFASRNHGGMSDQGHEFTMTARLDPKNAKAVLGILIGHTLDQSGEHLPIGWYGLGLHAFPSPPNAIGIAPKEVKPQPARSLSTYMGTTAVAGPCSRSSNRSAPSDGSRLSSTAWAPVFFASNTNPAAG